MKILLLSVRPDERAAIEKWGNRHPDVALTIAEWELHSETVDQVAGFDGLVIQQRTQIESDVYPRLHELGIKQLTTRTAGYDVIDLKAAAENDLIVSNVPAYSPRSVAELALTHTLRLIRKQELVDQRVREQDFRWAGLQGSEIHSLTIGIIGAGRIGGTAARLFHALDAKVIAYDIKPNHELDDVLTFLSFEEVLQQADVICLHVDLNDTSRGLIDEAALALMKPTAYLINECRGPVVDTSTLLAALAEKRLAGAALDTMVGEETFFNFDLRGQALPNQDLIQLRQYDNVIITPHVGFYTNIAVQNMVDISLDDTVAILSGKASEHTVG
ncbi:D-2-hydroxyacid dehydrogenase [Weissella paramesenteroides]|uniref:D-2-hydroxyacid dehydrogenase n=1 Tax=Weissella paramesenteroides TaxID=1249 RepID=A0ABD4XIR9_WEIPA|nr:D-2-hydroxyacid dehydrogenase [Weissella paramesenteroides]MDF8368947.1 D-2-hydroxyacid dehydrogenase [Weissella paramesenteroides]MDF8370960.1 D-2-hydroxyacid dehydrogenase [Weissella paramesenteroides]